MLSWFSLMTFESHACIHAACFLAYEEVCISLAEIEYLTRGLLVVKFRHPAYPWYF